MRRSKRSRARCLKFRSMAQREFSLLSLAVRILRCTKLPRRRKLLQDRLTTTRASSSVRTSTTRWVTKCVLPLLQPDLIIAKCVARQALLAMWRLRLDRHGSQHLWRVVTISVAPRVLLHHTKHRSNLERFLRQYRQRSHKWNEWFRRSVRHTRSQHLEHRW